MKHLMLLCFLAVTSSLLSGCDLDLGSSFDPVEKTLYIDYYREPCSDNSIDLCFRTRFKDEQSFTLMSKPLTGFDSLLWGKRYQVSVEVERTNSGKDASYTLLAIDAVEEMDPTISDFVLSLDMSSGILVNNATDDSASSWLLAGQKVFVCIADDCAAINNALATNKTIQLNFRIDNNELILQEVKCSATADVFAAECEGVSERAWDIAHFKSDCGSYFPAWCHIYKDTAESSANYKLLPIDIDDFSEPTYQWGKQYDLRVSSTIEADSLINAVFVEQKEVADIDDVFRTVMRFQPNSIVNSSQGELSYLGEIFDCAVNRTCSDLDRIIDDVNANDGKERIVIVEASATTVDTQSDRQSDSSSNVKLSVERILCDALVADFKVDCIDQYDDVYWPVR